VTASHEWVISADGTAIAVRRSGAGPALVLVHGTTADHTRWARVAPLLEAEFTVHAMDRRGRGGSGDADGYAIEREAEDVAAVVLAAGTPVSLLGHSYGAICCLEAALRLSALHRLILYEPPLPVGQPVVPPAVRDAIDRLVAAGEGEAALLTFFRDVVRVPEPQLAAMRAMPSWAGRVAAAHTLSRETRLEAEYRPDLERLRTLRTPTLLLLGGESPPFFREATRRIAEGVPDARIHELPGQQHVAMDIIPDDFARIVADFARPGSE
jgi:pimeloyl-ACP methyl ester carboxylesterase